MKIAVTYNSPAGETFIERGNPTNEWLPPAQVERVVDALRHLGHEVETIEADFRLVDRLRDFFGPEREQEWPGMVFNLAYGLQGGMRYCHVPSILEMLGLPYLGSDPLGQALASDKLTAKRVFRALNVSTPDYAVYEPTENGSPRQSNLNGEGIIIPDVHHRVVVKPIGEAVSEGLELVDNQVSMDQAVQRDMDQFGSPVLAEQFLGGRELNVSLIGNDPIHTLPPAEIILEDSMLYDADTKRGHKGDVHVRCPADLPLSLRQEARDLAVRAFTALRCRDWARVDLRLNEEGVPYVLEVNTIPGFGPSSSFFAAAQAAGLKDYEELIQMLVNVVLRRNRQTSAPLWLADPVTQELR